MKLLLGISVVSLWILVHTDSAGSHEVVQKRTEENVHKNDEALESLKFNENEVFLPNRLRRHATIETKQKSTDAGEDATVYVEQGIDFTLNVERRPHQRTHARHVHGMEKTHRRHADATLSAGPRSHRGRLQAVVVSGARSDVEDEAGSLQMSINGISKHKGKHGKHKSKEKGKGKSNEKGKGHKSKEKSKGKSKEKSKEISEESEESKIDTNVPSGQTVRLRGGDAVNAGRLEVYHAGQWQAVCRSGIDETTARVMCQLLGFDGGYSARPGARRYELPPTEESLSSVQCSGHEQRVRDCLISESDEECPRYQGLQCVHNSGCTGGWVAYDGLCYKVFYEDYSFDSAHTACEMMEAHLVSVQSQQESDFISQLLYSKYRRDEQRYWSGGERRRESGSGRQFYEVMAWKGTPHLFDFLKWFPGFPPDSLRQEPTQVDDENCVSLTNEYSVNDESYDVGYYFWDDVTCDVRLPFVCQHVAERDASDCYSGNGADYRGNASRTERGSLCISWDDATSLTVNPDTHSNAGLGGHSYCRNPDGDARPWCWTTNADRGKFGYCNVVECPPPKHTTATTTITTTLSADDDCYSGNGEEYRGTVTNTEKDTPCVSWADSEKINPQTHPNKGLGDHGYCRNPDSDARPWCYVDHEQLTFGYCPIPVCVTTVPPTVTCYNGDGEDYRGTFATSISGTACAKWSDARSINPTTHPNKGLGEHNYCRNPDGDVKPWCWTHAMFGEWSFCDMVPCGGTPTTTSADLSCAYDQFKCTRPDMCISAEWLCDGEEDCSSGEDEQHCEPDVSTTVFPATCAADEFRCSMSEQCIPNTWRCDGDIDCRLHEDEESCDDHYLSKFQHSVGFKLDVPTRRRTAASYTEIIYRNAQLTECATMCIKEMSIICLSFNYDTEAEKCALYNVDKSTLGLVASTDPQYYERITQAVNNCTVPNWFLCGTKKCIEIEKVCNGINNCNDFSDELDCAGIDPVEVRLADGSTEHEGRVEVKYMGQWGIVCDDGWGIHDADVICKQLGYSAAASAVLLSGFGSGNLNFLLDDVQCTGKETNIGDCAHNGWGMHDCLAYEAAGVICKSGKVCTDDKFMCGDGSCLAARKICDGVFDCLDLTDEKYCSDVGMQLVGGDTDKEGRLQITRNGLKGSVCDDSFNLEEAMVVCKALQLGEYGVAFHGAHFGQGTGPIWLDDVTCEGTEFSLAECAHSGWGHNNCNHDEDVGVRCFTTEGEMPDTTLPPTLFPPGLYTTSPAPTSGTCGHRYYHQNAPRIVGGFDAQYGAYPWQATLQKSQGVWSIYSHWCGGTIINDKWILTAAHCVDDIDKDEFRIIVGDYDNEAPDLYQQQFDIEELIVHEEFVGYADSFDHDISLIKIKPRRADRGNGGHIVFSEYVQPACLPESDTDYRDGHQCMVSGWGSTGWGSQGAHSYPEKMQAAFIPIIDHATCSRLYKNEITENMFCAGFEEGNIDSCKGDSGGPLVCLVNDKYTLLGATSWGNGCAQPKAPGVYTKIAVLIDWVHETMENFN